MMKKEREFMNILFATSEIAGLYKIGGLGDVSSSLPQALSSLGVNVSVTMPYYKDVKVEKVTGIGSLSVEFGGKKELVFIFAAPLGSLTGPTVYLFRHPKLLQYHSNKIVETFAFYSKIIAQFYHAAPQLVDITFDIVHCHDWHTALIPLLLEEKNKNVKTILTLHNVMYQGVTSTHLIHAVGLPKRAFHIFEHKNVEDVSLLREGLEYADVITTVSPSYAAEIIREDHGRYIGNILKDRKNSVKGILNGIDTDLWNPGHDHLLACKYDATTVFHVKPRIKAALQKECGLPVEDIPLLGFVGRLEPNQKGIDIFIEALETLLPDRTLQVIVLGTGEPKTEELLRDLARHYKEKVAFLHEFDESVAHRIYAGVDVLAVPSKFEPCGLTQMIAMRYGTLPLVRATGGLKDTIDDGKTGFVFDAYTGEALAQRLRSVLTIWHTDTELWHEMVGRAMQEDVSWKKRAKEYISLYKGLCHTGK